MAATATLSTFKEWSDGLAIDRDTRKLIAAKATEIATAEGLKCPRTTRKYASGTYTVKRYPAGLLDRAFDAVLEDARND